MYVVIPGKDQSYIRHPPVIDIEILNRTTNYVSSFTHKQLTYLGQKGRSGQTG